MRRWRFEILSINMKTTNTRTLADIAAHIEENYVFVDSGGQGRLNKVGCAAYLKEALGVQLGAPVLASPLSNRDLDRAAEIIATYEAHHDEKAVASVLRGIIENSSKIGELNDWLKPCSEEISRGQNHCPNGVNVVTRQLEPQEIAEIIYKWSRHVAQ
jgi:hypothetical protein